MEYDGNRPSTMTVKDWLVRRMSVDMMVSESVIHRIVDHQMNSIRKALDVHLSVEASGFGKFVFNRKKAQRKLDKFYVIKGFQEAMVNDENETERKQKSAEFKLHKTMLEIEALKKRL